MENFALIFKLKKRKNQNLEMLQGRLQATRKKLKDRNIYFSTILLMSAGTFEAFPTSILIRERFLRKNRRSHQHLVVGKKVRLKAEEKCSYIIMLLYKKSRLKTKLIKN
jgi:hypothetical protein